MGETAENNRSLALFISADNESVICVMESSKAVIVLQALKSAAAP